MGVLVRASETPWPLCDLTPRSRDRQRTHSGSSIGSWFGRDGLHVIGQRVHVDGTKIGARLRRYLVEPDERMLQPMLVVALRIILARMRAAGFRARGRGIDGDYGLPDKVVEFERFDEIGIPNHAAIGNADVGNAAKHL